jgi:ABC-type multidrug transport system fused ATPase/permease subunit
LLGLALFQFLTGILDLIGIVFIGGLAALSINGINSRSPGDRVTKLLEILHIQDKSFEIQVLVLTLSATFCLLARTVISILITRRTLHFLAKISAQLSNKLFSKLMNSNYKTITENSSQELSFAVNRGMDLLVVGTLGTAVSLIVDVTSLVLITGALFVVDTLVAIITLTLFASTGFVLYQLTHRRGNRLGREKSNLEIATSIKFLEAIDTFREISIHDRQSHYSENIGKMRSKYSYAVAEMSFLPNVSKFVIEALVVLTAVLIGFSQFLINDAFRAIGTITMFLAAGSRIAPAALRVQQGFLVLRINSGQIQPTLTLMNKLSSDSYESLKNEELNSENLTFRPEIVLSKVNFKHNETDKFALSNVDLTIAPGEMVALVGPSGAGKSTLVDLILGILDINSGSILISSESPKQIIKRFPLSMSYLPQTISLINGSIRENVCLGFAEGEFSDEEIWNALETASLKEYFQGQGLGLDFQIGENGNALSGGQRQRIGIARALITNPKVLVLDEATSALDAETESTISRTLENLKGVVTVIIVAHRLSSVKNADKLVYLKDGKILAVGSFNEVRASVPDFDSQVSLMTL